MFENESHPHHMSLTVHLITLQNSSKISVCSVTSYVSKVQIINHENNFQFCPYVIFKSSAHNNLYMRSNRTIAGVIDNAATCCIYSLQVVIIKVTTVHADLFSCVAHSSR